VTGDIALEDCQRRARIGVHRIGTARNDLKAHVDHQLPSARPID
jgi:hypothetical protein